MWLPSIRYLYPGRRQRSLRSRCLALGFDRDVASRLSSANPSINASTTPAVAFEPNSRWASPILPSRKSKCHQVVGAEVFDTTTDPAIELPVCSHGIKHILTYKLAVGRFVIVPSVPQIGQTLPVIRTVLAHTEAVSDMSVARPGGRNRFAIITSRCSMVT